MLLLTIGIPLALNASLGSILTSTDGAGASGMMRLAAKGLGALTILLYATWLTCSLAAVYFGVTATLRAKSSLRRDGRGTALFGLIAGGAQVFLFLLLLTIMIPSISRAKEQARHVVEQRNQTASTSAPGARGIPTTTLRPGVVRTPWAGIFPDGDPVLIALTTQTPDSSQRLCGIGPGTSLRDAADQLFEAGSLASLLREQGPALARAMDRRLREAGVSTIGPEEATTVKHSTFRLVVEATAAMARPNGTPPEFETLPGEKKVTMEDGRIAHMNVTLPARPNGQEWIEVPIAAKLRILEACVVTADGEVVALAALPETEFCAWPKTRACDVASGTVVYEGVGGWNRDAQWVVTPSDSTLLGGLLTCSGSLKESAETNPRRAAEPILASLTSKQTLLTRLSATGKADPDECLRIAKLTLRAGLVEETFPPLETLCEATDPAVRKAAMAVVLEPVGNPPPGAPPLPSKETLARMLKSRSATMQNAAILLCAADKQMISDDAMRALLGEANRLPPEAVARLLEEVASRPVPDLYEAMLSMLAQQGRWNWMPKISSDRLAAMPEATAREFILLLLRPSVGDEERSRLAANRGAALICLAQRKDPLALDVQGLDIAREFPQDALAAYALALRNDKARALLLQMAAHDDNTTGAATSCRLSISIANMIAGEILATKWEAGADVLVPILTNPLIPQETRVAIIEKAQEADARHVLLALKEAQQKINTRRDVDVAKALAAAIPVIGKYFSKLKVAEALLQSGNRDGAIKTCRAVLAEVTTGPDADRARAMLKEAGVDSGPPPG